MYVLTIANDQNKRIYFYRKVNDKIQVLTFESQQAAQKCIQLFQNYSIERLMTETGDPFGFGKIMAVCSTAKIEPLPKLECETYSFEKIMREKGYEI